MTLDLKPTDTPRPKASINLWKTRLPFIMVAVALTITMGIVFGPSIRDYYAGRQLSELERLGRRADALFEQGKSDQAMKEIDEALAHSRDKAQMYIMRGAYHFRRGAFAESVSDFDKLIEIEPQATPFLWQRGISLYYAEKYNEGKEQFGWHIDIKPNDVENTFWHFLCNAKANGIDTARKELRLAEWDPRPPLMQVQQMLQGDLTPEEVIEACQIPISNEYIQKLTRFQGYLYVGLYCDAANLPEQSKSYLTQCLEMEMPGFMSDVAKHHLSKLNR
jgi:lipoprotein NlpI